MPIYPHFLRLQAHGAAKLLVGGVAANAESAVDRGLTTLLHEILRVPEFRNALAATAKSATAKGARGTQVGTKISPLVQAQTAPAAAAAQPPTRTDARQHESVAQIGQLLERLRLRHANRAGSQA